MDQKRIYTTGTVANLLHVHQSTVIDWAEKGLLATYRTPGGHRRIERASLLAFLAHHDMPIPATLRGESHEPPVGVEHAHHGHEAFHLNPNASSSTGPGKGRR